MQALEHIEITIRVNVTAENTAEVRDLIVELGKWGLEKRYYLAHVHDHQQEYSVKPVALGKGGANLLPIIDPPGQSLPRPAFAEFERVSLLTRPEGLSAMLNKLKPKTHACAATTKSALVIDPAGYVSRCWHSAGQTEESMFNVCDFGDVSEDSSVASRWLGYSPFPYTTCSTCRVLPLCMGGCSHPRVFMGTTDPACEAIRENIDFCVSEIGKRLDVPSVNHKKTLS